MKKLSGLTLTRKPSETIRLQIPNGKDYTEVHIGVESVRGSRVKLKFSAPQSIRITRSELTGD